jgi:hypothetical protein
MRFMLALAVVAMFLVIAGCVSGAPQTKTPAMNTTVPTNLSTQSGTASENTTANLTLLNATGANVTTSGNATANLSTNSTVQNASSNLTMPANATNPSMESNVTRNATGTVFGDGQYSLFVDDLSTATGQVCALLSVHYASNDSVITKLDVCPGESENWVDPGGRVFRIVVLKTAAGYSGSTGWAQVEIFG